MLRCNQIINARHGAAKPQNTANAEKSAAKLWQVGVALAPLPSVADGAHYLLLRQCHSQQAHLQRYCEQMAFPDGDLMSQAKILEFSALACR